MIDRKIRRYKMNRQRTKIILLTAALVLFYAVTISAQNNPFAPQAAPPLPAGMTGADVNDPRAKLKPGMYDAGEAAYGLKLLSMLKKPEPFQLASDPNDAKVNKGVTA